MAQLPPDLCTDAFKALLARRLGHYIMGQIQARLRWFSGRSMFPSDLSGLGRAIGYPRNTFSSSKKNEFVVIKLHLIASVLGKPVDHFLPPLDLLLRDTLIDWFRADGRTYDETLIAKALAQFLETPSFHEPLVALLKNPSLSTDS